MTISRSLLERGYFPKELPPAFFTEGFAAYASTKKGKALLDGYKASGNSTDCVVFDLALPGLARRPLRIPHPTAFSSLARLISKNFRRLLSKSGRSPFSKRRPIYAAGKFRALNPNVKPANLTRERAATRAGGSYLVKLDVSHFYPSLYTHAVGWAIDPRLRSPKNWKNFKLLGKQVPIPATLVPAMTVKVGSTITPSAEARDQLLLLLLEISQRTRNSHERPQPLLFLQKSNTKTTYDDGRPVLRGSGER